MASSALIFYSKNKDDLRVNDLTGAVVKVALVASTYTPNTDSSTGHSLYSDVSAHSLATGFGYTAGGQALTTDVATAISGGFKYSSDNPTWTATGGSIPAWRYAVFYVEGTLRGMTNPLIGYFLGDTTPADIPATTDTNTLTIACPAGGWFDIT